MPQLPGPTPGPGSPGLPGGGAVCGLAAPPPGAWGLRGVGRCAAAPPSPLLASPGDPLCWARPGSRSRRRSLQPLHSPPGSPAPHPPAHPRVPFPGALSRPPLLRPRSPGLLGAGGARSPGEELCAAAQPPAPSPSAPPGAGGERGAQGDGGRRREGTIGLWQPPPSTGCAPIWAPEPLGEQGRAGSCAAGCGCSLLSRKAEEGQVGHLRHLPIVVPSFSGSELWAGLTDLSPDLIHKASWEPGCPPPPPCPAAPSPQPGLEESQSRVQGWSTCRHLQPGFCELVQL